MEQTNIHELRNSFVFTQNEDEERQLLKHDITRIADLAIEEFYKNHIKDNEKLSQYLVTVDASRVLRMMKEFFVFIFTAPP